MKEYYLGIDTSAYTTSISLIDEDNNIIKDLRKTLEVKDKQKGLRQQEAVFQHVNNLPILGEKLFKDIDVAKINTISVSTKPRNISKSYMPVFVVGKGQAFILSQALNTEYKEFSHQEGHIAAGMLENKFKVNEKFLSLHISGGTTELLLVENKEDNLKIDLIGGSLDISIGQLIDRIGVYLGYRFPCGKELDQLSKEGNIIDIKVPMSIKDLTWINISGLENYFVNLIKLDKYPMEDIILTIFHTISIIVENLIMNSLNHLRIERVLITGGVSSNSYIRNCILSKLDKKGIETIFPPRNLCTDNGVGVAYLGKTKKFSIEAF